VAWNTVAASPSAAVAIPNASAAIIGERGEVVVHLLESRDGSSFQPPDHLGSLCQDRRDDCQGEAHILSMSNRESDRLG